MKKLEFKAFRSLGVWELLPGLTYISHCTISKDGVCRLWCRKLSFGFLCWYGDLTLYTKSDRRWIDKNHYPEAE